MDFCGAEAFSNGQTAQCTTVNSKRMRSLAKAPTSGVMDPSTRAMSRMGSDMAKVHMSMRMKESSTPVLGRTE